VPGRFAGVDGRASRWGVVDVVPLRAIALPAPEAAVAIAEAWAEGVAVLPLDPAAPPDARARVLARLRPTELLDGDGRRALTDGEPAQPGTAAVVATSGTTGEPKGVVLAHAALEASARAVSAALDTTSADRWLACVPLHHVAGLSILVRARVAGCELEVHPRFDVAAVAAAAGRATLVSLVPTTLSRLLADPAGRAALPRFRSILLGGGPIPLATLAEARTLGADVHTTYGLTETCGGVVHDGHALPGVDLRAAPDGEVLVRGPMVLTGLRPAELPSPLDADGWLHTGDAGHVDAATGLLTITDRLRDLVITGGVNVSPTAVERVLATVAGVADVAVAGAPDDEWGERVVAWVVARDPVPTLAALRAAATERLGAAHAPRQLVLVEELPRSASGKLLRRSLPPPPPARPASGPR
jgi:o-succinylbenzoate---CoA ligase